MSTEYIERGAAIALLNKNITGEDNPTSELRKTFAGIAECTLRIIPAADVEPVVHARWEWRNGRLVCSKCGKEANGFYDSEEGVSRYYPTKFCQDCGAHMDERSEHED